VKIYTLGYQGLSPELYVRTLINAGVGLVLDVREHAWSQRPEFVASTLQKALLSSGREYLARNPTCLRGLLFAIEAASSNRRPACLTCYERPYTECHRSVLIEELIRLEPTIRAIHLEPSISPKARKGKQATDKSHSPFGSSFVAPAFLPFT
jgi:uncharacterized protein (DUF488 family)